MIICEYNFLDSDPQDPRYSMSEPDIYAPRGKVIDGIPPHGLRLRKNLVENKYEIIRVYYRPQREAAMARLRMGKPVEITKEKAVEVAFSSEDFAEALEWENREWVKYFGEDERKDIPCTHGDTGTTDMFCPVVKGLVDPNNPKPWR